MRRGGNGVPAPKILLAAAVLLNLYGCGSIASSHINPDGRTRVRFSTHDASTACAKTYGCKIRYASLWHGYEDDGVLTPPLRPDLLTASMSGEISIENFPEPAVIEWRSSDGEAHREVLDMKEIFKDEAFFHSVPEGEVDKVSRSPEILIVVEDRTIRVYLKIFISLKHPVDPVNRFSDYKLEANLVFEKTY